MIKKMIIILAILISILFSGCGIIPEPPESKNKIVYRFYGIGVGDYLFFGSNVDLDSPSPNIEKLEEIFNQCKFGEEEIKFTLIEKLLDHNATKENILSGILETFANADDNDVSYFYYMGHGGVSDGIPVITPTDTKFTLETDITVHELEEYLSMIAGTKVVFIESCHSGNFIDKGEKDFNDLVIDIFSQNNIDLLTSEQYQVLTSCAGDQTCWEQSNADPPYSYFTMGLYKGCLNLNADVNKDGIVNLYEAHKYTKEWVWENTNKNQNAQIYPDNSTFPIVEY